MVYVLVWDTDYPEMFPDFHGWDTDCPVLFPGWGTEYPAMFPARDTDYPEMFSDRVQNIMRYSLVGPHTILGCSLAG